MKSCCLKHVVYINGHTFESTNFGGIVTAVGVSTTQLTTIIETPSEHLTGKRERER